MTISTFTSKRKTTTTTRRKTGPIDDTTANRYSKNGNTVGSSNIGLSRQTGTFNAAGNSRLSSGVSGLGHSFGGNVTGTSSYNKVTTKKTTYTSNAPKDFGFGKKTDYKFNSRREDFKYKPLTSGKIYDDHEYTNTHAMRYGRCPNRGGATNKYSEANPYPKSEIVIDRLKPGYREQWLQSLESKVPDRSEEFDQMRSEMKERLQQSISTPRKDGKFTPLADRSTGIKTTTSIKKTTKYEHNRPATSRFNVNGPSKTIRESTVVSNKVFGSIV